PLITVHPDGDRPELQRSAATSLLARCAADRPEILADLVADADPRQYAALFPLLEKHGDRAVALMTAELERPARDRETKEAHAGRQANAAVTLLRLGRPERVWPLLRHGPDPSVRSHLIHRLAPLGADAAILGRRLGDEMDVSARRALLLGLGEYRPEDLAAPERTALTNLLFQLLQDDPDAGV